jgi:hypothetical protein
VPAAHTHKRKPIMAQTDQAYIHESLQYPDSLRLLELLPGAKGSPLSCNLQEVRRSNSPKYEALSYAWGEPVFSHEVQEVASNERLSITVNLHDALQAIRYEQESRFLWVDAICINQSALKEKNHQVASMGKIFGDAWRVVVWLSHAPNRVMCIFQDLIQSFQVWEKNRPLGHTNVARLFNMHAFQQQWYVSHRSFFFDVYQQRMDRTVQTSRQNSR